MTDRLHSHGSEDRYQAGCRCEECQAGHRWFGRWVASRKEFRDSRESVSHRYSVPAGVIERLRQTLAQAETNHGGDPF